MRHNRVSVWLLAVCAVSLSVTAMAASKASDTPAASLAAILKDYRTYQADFIQIVVDAKGSKVQESRGHLKAKRPGLFYWESAKPMSQFIAADGKMVKVYDPDLEQVTIQPMDKQLASTPALLLSGQVDNLAQTYDVSVEKQGKHTTEFTLVPKSPDSLFVSLRLTFYKGELQEMRLHDSLDQRSILSFDHIVVNEPIDNAAFDLQYPDDVDVIQGGN
ncbi:MAG: outer membrane lipoprotein chaperone LolA [Marinobacter sp.]|nr:outer membrane lipoprotein chaperone LolA [Marinobacter sp.]